MDISQKCLELARLALKKYKTEDEEAAAQWMAKRIAKGIEDDIEDLEKQNHITKIPF